MVTRLIVLDGMPDGYRLKKVGEQGGLPERQIVRILKSKVLGRRRVTEVVSLEGTKPAGKQVDYDIDTAECKCRMCYDSAMSEAFSGWKLQVGRAGDGTRTSGVERVYRSPADALNVSILRPRAVCVSPLDLSAPFRLRVRPK